MFKVALNTRNQTIYMTRPYLHTKCHAGEQVIDTRLLRKKQKTVDKVFSCLPCKVPNNGHS